jgi:type III secretion protein R
MNDAPSTVGLIIFLTALGLLPFFMVTMTAFLKISVVMFILRNALGLQQTPPTIVLYSIALILTVFVSLPLIEDVSDRLAAHPLDTSSLEKLQESAKVVKDPVKAYLIRFAKPGERQFFLSSTARIWPESARANVKDDDFIILLPAFVSSELTRAFEIGFLLFLPFLIIDLVVASVLMAMGMMMLPPVVVSLPFKLIFFVLVDGWSLVAGSLVQSYGGG